MSDEIVEVVGSVDDLENGQYVDSFCWYCFWIQTFWLLCVSFG